MLTAMKLTGRADGLAAYHCGQENYYFKQATELENQVMKAGLQSERSDALEYVQAHGKLCKDMGLTDGQQINEATFRNLLYGRDVSGIQRSKKHKVTGIDLTFSAPKSGSIAGLVIDKSPTITQAQDRVWDNIRKGVPIIPQETKPRKDDTRTARLNDKVGQVEPRNSRTRQQ